MALIYGDLLILHPPKTGGHSITAYLNGHSTEAQASGWAPTNHVPLKDIERYSNRTLDSWSKIILVHRDPYEQQLSQWWHWRDSYARGGRHPCEMESVLAPDLTWWLLSPLSDWRVWYDHEGRASARSFMDAHERLSEIGYYPWWFTVDGEVPECVEVIPFEQLGSALPEAVAPWCKGQVHEMPHENQSAKRNTAMYYTNLGFQLVEARCHWAFNEHGPGYVRWVDRV